MTSTSGSTRRSRPVSTAAVVAHGRVDVDPAVDRVRVVAERAGVTLVNDPRGADVAVAIGGDGTMLRTLAKLLGSGVPVIGVNFGRGGFLASVHPDDLEHDLGRGFAGDDPAIDLPALAESPDGGR